VFNLKQLPVYSEHGMAVLDEQILQFFSCSLILSNLKINPVLSQGEIILTQLNKIN